MPVTGIPAPSNAFFVPPVDITSYPTSTNPLTKGTKLVLSLTLTNTLFIINPPINFLILLDTSDVQSHELKLPHPQWYQIILEV